MSSYKDIERDMYLVAASVLKSILKPGSQPAKVLLFLNTVDSARNQDITKATGVEWLVGGPSGYRGPMHKLLDEGLVERISRGVYKITENGKTECQVLTGEYIPEKLHPRYNPVKRDKNGLHIAIRNDESVTIPPDVFEKLKAISKTRSESPFNQHILTFVDPDTGETHQINRMGHTGGFILYLGGGSYIHRDIPKAWFSDKSQPFSWPSAEDNVPSDDEFFKS